MRKGYVIWFNECYGSRLAGGSSLIKSLVLSIPVGSDQESFCSFGTFWFNGLNQSSLPQ